jgi:trans-aconitate methyltransferase
MSSAYHEDLAYIHHAGFGRLATSAAATVLNELNVCEILDGTVVDLGCGSGIMAKSLREANYKVIGIDISSSFIEAARRRVPTAEFYLGSFITTSIPPCIAVTAIGEVFNYLLDPENGEAMRLEVWRRIYNSLESGGLLIFDMAGPLCVPATKSLRAFADGPDWAVLVETSADKAKTLLTRRITTFRKEGDLYRRRLETHQLELVDQAKIVRTLEDIGFSVLTMDGYSAMSLPSGIVVFVARKP